jgi:hypothetical protein
MGRAGGSPFDCAQDKQTRPSETFVRFGGKIKAGNLKVAAT